MSVLADDSLLLFSGGLDSTALAAKLSPKLLFVDYGQASAGGEHAAATRVAAALELPLISVSLGIRDFGSGLLHGAEHVGPAPSPEWWPYRNQFLLTAGAAIALREGCRSVWLGSVKGDGERHLDGSETFYQLADTLVAYQEGGIRVEAPGISQTTEELITSTELPTSVIGWTFSCHRADLPCGECPGCWKRQRVLANLGIDGYSWNV